jgi:hypothetical protein
LLTSRASGAASASQQAASSSSSQASAPYLQPSSSQTVFFQGAFTRAAHLQTMCVCSVHDTHMPCTHTILPPYSKVSQSHDGGEPGLRAHAQLAQPAQLLSARCARGATARARLRRVRGVLRRHAQGVRRGLRQRRCTSVPALPPLSMRRGRPNRQSRRSPLPHLPVSPLKP